MMVVKDPLALTLARSERLRQQQRSEKLLQEVNAQQEATEALQRRANQLRAQLEQPPPAQLPPPHPTLESMMAQAVSRELGVWTVSERRLGGRALVTVRLRPEPAGQTYNMQLSVTDNALAVPSYHLPPGVRVKELLEKHAQSGRSQMSGFVYAVAREVEAFARRHHQVEELRRTMPSKQCSLWHDPACRDVRPSLTVLTAGGARIKVLLQLLYEPDAVLPYECRTLDSGGLDKEDRDELATVTGVFLEQPLAQAFTDAFQ